MTTRAFAHRRDDAVEPIDAETRTPLVEPEFDIGPDPEFIAPPLDLKRKARQMPSRDGELEPVAAAEAAVARMADNFDAWMVDESARLAELWTEVDGRLDDDELREAFHRAAHDIKGQAATLGFPLAGRIAASLCRLVDGSLDGDLIPRDLVRQHVQSVRAIIAEHAREEGSATARRLVERLDEVTSDYLRQIDGAA